MELFILVVVSIICACFCLRDRTKIEIPGDPLEKLVRPKIVEDTSHLKSQLEEYKSKNYWLTENMGELRVNLRQQEERALEITKELVDLNRKYEKLQHQNKSSQVRTGFLAEAVLPLHEEFPVDPKTMRFLGSPVDYVSFCYETNMITFVEVKTGDSQLNENQRAVRKMVDEGRVEFKIVRLNEKGVKVK